MTIEGYIGGMTSLLMDSRDSKKMMEYGSLNITELCCLPSLNISKETVAQIKPTFSFLDFLDDYT